MNCKNKRKIFEKGSYKTHTCSDTFVCKVCGRVCIPENARSSTGLGLFIARLLAEKRNGAISAAYKNGSLHICAAFPQTCGPVANLPGISAKNSSKSAEADTFRIRSGAAFPSAFLTSPPSAL